MGISVIIPTFDNIEFIDETLTSIYNSGKDLEYEILVGIDGCKKSLNYLERYQLCVKHESIVFKCREHETLTGIEIEKI
jgi:glycosyltransferase involved in cell wall biosynthesis